MLMLPHTWSSEVAMTASPRSSRSPSLGFTLLELMISVAIIAILAVVAVPQFTHYMRNARNAEATLMLDVVAKGAQAYYAAPRTGANGARLPCQFPVSAGLTPAVGTCCDPSVDTDQDSRCDEDPKAFDTPTWEALQFGLSGQHLFVYAFRASGSLRDQDCDGLMSTFVLVLNGDPGATNSGCDSVVSAGLYHDYETE